MTNHLWESTLFTGAMALLALVLRKNTARVRHWLWLAASLKFLFPFSLLVGVGNHFGFRTAAAPQVSYVMQGVREQLAAPEVHMAARASSSVDWLSVVWIGGSAVVLILWGVRFWRVRSAVLAASPMRMDIGMRVMSSGVLLEPGVFGIWRPVLLLPKGITERLTEEQLDAIVAHELCHVRRRDNLVAAIHMMVEALFWFHPLVWWIGARMVEERERACDEEVLRLGNVPEVYAEGILKICRFYVESPLECVAGVTGSDLKRRIEGIMTSGVARELDFARKMLLAVAGFAAVAAPIAVGIVNAPAMRAQSPSEPRLAFEVASVKRSLNTEERGGGLEFSPSGRMTAKQVPLIGLLTAAYSLPFQGPRLTGLPRELALELYDIDAVAPSGSIPAGASPLVRTAKMKLMLQSLLEDRFKMKIQRQTKELPIYAVIVGKNGPKLTKARIEEKDCSDIVTGKAIACHDFRGGMGRGLHADAVTITDVTNAVSNWADRPVVDRTGLEGLYEINTDGWAPMLPRPPRPDGADTEGIGDPTRPTLYMIFERLGLKMEASKGPVETFTIEHIERPSAN